MMFIHIRRNTAIAYYALRAFTSLCLNQQGTSGDSPLGMFNSANYTICADTAGADNLCFHGTMAAGVAAGRGNWYSRGVNLSGIAPNANIIGASVFSLRTRPSDDPNKPKVDLWGVEKDIIDALTALNANGTSNTTANLSIGDQTKRYTNCGNNPIVNLAVSQLVSKQIPVIVAAGNSGWNGTTFIDKAIEWPSCVPNVIKVAALKNLTPSPLNANPLVQNNVDEIASYSNLVEQSSVTGQIYLAPGCAYSAHTNGSAESLWNCGTSIAAPFVAGFFAVAKSAFPTLSVPDLIALINASASVNVTVPEFSTTFKRIKIVL